MNIAQRILHPAVCIALAIILGAPRVHAANQWNGGGGNPDWFDGSNWSEGVPSLGQDVTITTGTIDLTNATPELASFTMTGGTLTFQGWETALKATEMSIGATLTHAANTTNAPDPETGEWVPEHRIWLQGSNITITATGTLNADTMGYRLNAGPGRATSRYGGAGHAHTGGRSGDGHLGGPAYGDPAAPWQPGSSGGTHYLGGTGGGAIKIDATGMLILEGTLTANGTFGSYPHGPGGSGGSIWLTCHTFAGSATGLISANGSSRSGSGGGGSGGRIALHYDPSDQAALPDSRPSVRFQTSPGETKGNDITPYMGTLYLPDPLFLTENLSERRFWNTELVIPNFTNWVADRLTLDDCSLGLPEGFDLSITNNLVLTNNASLSILASPVYNPAIEDGATIQVGGHLELHDNAWIYPYADDTNGATVNISVGGNLHVDTLSGIDADYKGYRRGYGPGGMGLSTGIRGGGGGYGGAGSQGSGGFGGTAYGDPALARQPGSGANAAAISGRGGGAIRLAVEGNAWIDGTLTTRGGGGLYNGGAAGSGGGIAITCDTVQGAGLLRVDGGNGNNGGGSGGGGRIAVHYDPAAQAALPEPVPDLKFSAYAYPVAMTWNEEMGSLYLPDALFLTETLSDQRFWHTRLVIPGWTSWQPSGLTLDQCAILLPEGFALSIDSNLLLTNEASLFLKAAFTNSPEERFGASLTTGGDLVVSADCWIHPDANQTNGAIVQIRIEGDAVIAATGGIQADGEGYLPQSGNLNGPGAGQNIYSGGGYGGIGGYTAGGITYGLPQALPRHPGSPGGYNGHKSGGGGGAIHLLVGNTLRLDGSLTANGRNGLYASGPAGSGGSILVGARRIQGSGTLTANGGSGNSDKGAGGGGRIAVWHRTSLSGFDKIFGSLDLNGVGTNELPIAFSGVLSANTGTAGAAGEDGTAGFYVPPPSGTLFMLR